jgi:hypothetical protein
MRWGEGLREIAGDSREQRVTPCLALPAIAQAKLACCTAVTCGTVLWHERAVRRQWIPENVL